MSTKVSLIHVHCEAEDIRHVEGILAPAQPFHYICVGDVTLFVDRDAAMKLATTALEVVNAINGEEKKKDEPVPISTIKEMVDNGEVARTHDGSL